MGKLFDEEFLKKLEYLYVLSKKLFAGKQRAQTRSKKIGWGMEFADYRDYTPGDDPRYLDWNLYARVGTLVTKLFHEEENLNVYFLLDASLSMDYGHPSKFEYAKKVAAALGYVSLSNLDTVAIQPFGGELLAPLEPIRGKGRVMKMFEYLENLPPAPRTDIAKAVSAFVAKTKTKGLLVVISDFWDEEGYERALKTAYSAGFDLSAVCLHHDYEAEPKWRGNVTMADSETGKRLQVTISNRTLKKYHAEYESYLERLRTVCHVLHCHYLYARTSLPFEDMILNVFRQGHFIK
ncbi:MAG: DUF58 domain-containing protein [Candidatus Lernaella stagnicola]|nr:DUF58 domain-containing protein [Candidatus Lernaella stagnicola]